MSCQDARRRVSYRERAVLKTDLVTSSATPASQTRSSVSASLVEPARAPRAMQATRTRHPALVSVSQSANRIPPFLRHLSGLGVLHARPFPFRHHRARAPGSARDGPRLAMSLSLCKHSSSKTPQTHSDSINRFYIASQRLPFCHSFSFCQLELQIRSFWRFSVRSCYQYPRIRASLLLQPIERCPTTIRSTALNTIRASCFSIPPLGASIGLYSHHPIAHHSRTRRHSV